MSKNHPTQLTLHAALRHLQQQHAAIRLTPRSIANKRLPSHVRRCLKEHTREIREMIRACRIEVCPSAKLHRREWYFPGPEWTVGSAVCGICERLAAISEVKSNTSNYDKIKVPTKERRVNSCENHAKAWL